jgi:hypothetical protein
MAACCPKKRLETKPKTLKVTSLSVDDEADRSRKEKHIPRWKLYSGKSCSSLVALNFPSDERSSLDEDIFDILSR